MDDNHQQLRAEITAMRAELRTEIGVLREVSNEQGERITKLETILGVDDQKRGIISELEDVKSSISELKAFQIKLTAVFGAASVLLQVIVQHFFSK